MIDPSPPEDPAGLLACAKAELTEHRRQRAFPLFQRVARAAPESHEAYEAWTNLGDLHAAEEDWYQAGEAFRHALLLGPADGTVWARLGGALLCMRQYGSSQACYERALGLRAGQEPSLTPNINEEMQLHTPLPLPSGQQSDADAGPELAALVCALRYDPSDSEHWYWAGRVLRRLGRREEALRAFDRALEARIPDPTSTYPSIIWLDKALTLMDLRRYGEALAACDDALRVDSQDAQTWRVRGTALVGLRRSEAAIASFERAVAINPRYGAAWRQLATVLRMAAHEADAVAAEARADALPDGDAPPADTSF